LTFRILLSALFLAALTFIQASWLDPIRVLGVRPDLGLVAVVWLAYRRGPVEGCSASFISGFVDDALSVAPLGFNALVKTLVAWAASLFHGAIHVDRLFLPFLFVAGASILKALAVNGLSLLFRGALPAYDLLSRTLWVEVGYSALVAPLCFFLFDLAASLNGRRRQEGT
jgi:rod shape-determining protein MreD